MSPLLMLRTMQTPVGSRPAKPASALGARLSMKPGFPHEPPPYVAYDADACRRSRPAKPASALGARLSIDDEPWGKPGFPHEPPPYVAYDADACRRSRP